MLKSTRKIINEYFTVDKELFTDLLHHKLKNIILYLVTNRQDLNIKKGIYINWNYYADSFRYFSKYKKLSDKIFQKIMKETKKEFHHKKTTFRNLKPEDVIELIEIAKTVDRKLDKVYKQHLNIEKLKKIGQDFE